MHHLIGKAKDLYNQKGIHREEQQGLSIVESRSEDNYRGRDYYTEKVAKVSHQIPE